MFPRLSSFVIIFSTFSLAGIAQQQNYSLNHDQLLNLEEPLNNISSDIHTSLKPYLYKELEGSKDTSFHVEKIELQQKRKYPFLSISPILALQEGYDTYRSKAVTESGIGLSAFADIGKKISLGGTAFIAQSGFAEYVDSIIRITHVIPGMGRAYGSQSTYSFENYSGYLSYSPNKVFNFQIGKDKYFWGDGYRSLFLSDAATNYPFFKISATVWKLKYVSLMAMMKDIGSGDKKDFRNKYGTFHYLSWNATRRLNISLFESIIWQGADTNRSRGFDVNYMNPVIFYRPVEFSIGSSDNACLGFAFKIKVARKQQFYGQLLLDEFLLKEVLAMNGWWANKQAFQLGFKSFDLFGIKKLNYQLELNYVRPFTYSHGSIQQNYGHYNEPIAHPLGANFVEVVNILNYRYKGMLVEFKIVAATAGKNTSGANWGGNIFESYATRTSDYSNFTTQGLKTQLMTTDFRVAYLFSKKMDIQVEAGMTHRSESNALMDKKFNFFYLGIRTSLWNRYFDQ